MYVYVILDIDLIFIITNIYILSYFLCTNNYKIIGT